MDFSSEKPPASALYLVDRDKQGKYYRYYNAETDTWGTCGADMNEALAGKDTPSPVGFYPWVGPLTGKKFNPNKPVKNVETDVQLITSVEPLIEKPVKPAKPIVTKTTKTVHPDGTIFYREDRQKWVVIRSEEHTSELQSH